MRVFLLALTLLFAGCGYDDGGDVVYKKKKPQPTNPQWDGLKSLVDAECGRCHNGTTHPTVFNASNFGNSGVQARIANDSMPPDRDLDDETKARFLAYGN